MSIGHIGTDLSFYKDQFKALQGNSKLLNPSNAKNVQDLPEDERKTAKSMGINAGKVDLSNAWLDNIVEVNLKDWLGQDINTTNFEFVLNHNFDLNTEQKTALNNAIRVATGVMNKGMANGDTYGMRISQTNMELKYISQKFIPEKYQEEYNSYVDKYTKALSEHFVDFEKTFAEDLAHTTSDSLIASGWKERGKEILDNISNGQDIFQASLRDYQDLYNNVDVTNPKTVKGQMDSLYKNILTKQTSTWWGIDNTSLSSEVKYLAEKWNSLMDVLGEKNNKFTTSIDYTA